MTQYAVLIYADDSAQADDTAAHDRHAQQLTDSGGLVAAYALTPREAATSVRADAVTDGPFIEGKEIVAGFYVLEAADLDAALALARQNPVLLSGGGVEVRPILAGGVVDRT